MWKLPWCRFEMNSGSEMYILYFFSLEESEKKKKKKKNSPENPKRLCRLIFNAQMIGAHISQCSDTAVTLWGTTTSRETTSTLHCDTAGEFIKPSEEVLDFSVWLVTIWAMGRLYKYERWTTARDESTGLAKAADSKDTIEGQRQQARLLCASLSLHLHNILLRCCHSALALLCFVSHLFFFQATWLVYQCDKMWDRRILLIRRQ